MRIMPLNYLHITAHLQNNDLMNRQFQQYMSQLIPTFMQTPWPNWRLYISATREPGKLPSSHGSDRDKQSYMNIWQVQDYNTLPYIQNVLRDNLSYNSMSALVGSETEEFTGALSYNPRTVDPNFTLPNDIRFYLLMSLDTVTESLSVRNLKSLMFDVAYDESSPMRQDYDFSLVNATYSQTGVMRRFFFTWSTPSNHPKPEKAMAWFMDQPTVKKALTDTPTWSLWSPIQYTTPDPS